MKNNDLNELIHKLNTFIQFIKSTKLKIINIVILPCFKNYQFNKETYQCAGLLYLKFSIMRFNLSIHSYFFDKVSLIAF